MNRIRVFFLGVALLVAGASIPFSGGAGCSSPNPAAPPGPPAELPSALVIPSDLTIEVNEASGGGALSALKAQTSGPLREEIDSGINTVIDDNDRLDLILSPFKDASIPVDAHRTTFEAELNFDGLAEFKFDFRPFDLDGDGAAEACSGCTCPVGCAPDLAACPSEAPEDQLQPICFRIWVDGQRFMAGLFDRVPTAGNPESGRFRFVIPSITGPVFAVAYDQREAEDRLVDISACFGGAGTPCGDRRRDVVQQEGSEATSKKTIRLQFEQSTEPAGLAQYQAQFFSNLDFIALELIAAGSFEGPDIENLTPPICAQINSANPVADVLCSDIGLALTPGDFPVLPESGDVQLPPVSEFPETPTF